MKFSYLISVFAFILFSCSSSIDVDFSDAYWHPWGQIDSFSVMDADTDDPIVGASIYVEHLVNNELKTTTLITDQDGKVRADLGTITYVRVSADGYQTMIFEDGDYARPIRLTPIDG